jgi:hypothetical protein
LEYLYRYCSTGTTEELEIVEHLSYRYLHSYQVPLYSSSMTNNFHGAVRNVNPNSHKILSGLCAIFRDTHMYMTYETAFVRWIAESMPCSYIGKHYEKKNRYRHNQHSPPCIFIFMPIGRSTWLDRQFLLHRRSLSRISIIGRFDLLSHCVATCCKAV